MVGHRSGRVGRRRLHLPVGRLLQARRGGHRRGGTPHERLGRHRRRLPPQHLRGRTGRIPTGADLAHRVRPTPQRRRTGAHTVGVAVHRQPTQGHDLRPRARRAGAGPPHAPRRQGEVGQERCRLARRHLRLRVGAAFRRSRTARRDPASGCRIPRALLLIGIDRGAPGALRSGRLAGAASRGRRGGRPDRRTRRGDGDAGVGPGKPRGRPGRDRRRPRRQHRLRPRRPHHGARRGPALHHRSATPRPLHRPRHPSGADPARSTRPGRAGRADRRTSGHRPGVGPRRVPRRRAPPAEQGGHGGFVRWVGQRRPHRAGRTGRPHRPPRRRRRTAGVVGAVPPGRADLQLPVASPRRRHPRPVR